MRLRLFESRVPAEHSLSCDLVEDILRLKAVMSPWDEPSRKVFVLRKVYSLTYAEIAAYTGMSDSAISECLASTARRIANAPLLAHWIT